MLGGGSSIFTNVQDYEAHLPLRMDLVVLQPGRFRARVSWVELPLVHLLRAREALPRIAYVSPTSGQILLTFPTHYASPLICDGVFLQKGEMMCYRPGERFHQRTAVDSTWGAILLTPATLTKYSRILIGRDVDLPVRGQVLRLDATSRRELLRLHARATRLAETGLDHLAHPEVARSFEQDLIVRVVTAMDESERSDRSSISARRVTVLMQLEEMLAAPSSSIPTVYDMCQTLGVSEQLLRTCCAQALGLTPSRYRQLRRLKQ